MCQDLAKGQFVPIFILFLAGEEIRKQMSHLSKRDYQHLKVQGHHREVSKRYTTSARQTGPHHPPPCQSFRQKNNSYHQRICLA